MTNQREDSPEARITRYDMVTNFRCGESIDELERADNGEWVRWEDVEGRLHEQAQEIERLKSLLDDLTNVEMIQRLRQRAEAAESALAAAKRVRQACACSTADPVMQSDGKFYCHACGLETGARPNCLEPETWFLRVRSLERQIAELTQGHTSPGRDTA